MMNRQSNKQMLIQIQNIHKRYGETLANDDICLDLLAGEVLGLVGANGAGKSTLTRVISGVTKPDSGTMKFCGEAVEWPSYRPAAAARLGIRVAYQELSLCTNLKVYENFYVEMGSHFSGVWRWRVAASLMAQRKLDEVFPEHGIRITQETAELSIAQQQMVEIARAFSAPGLRLIILDEPTSSLPAAQTNQLLDYIRKAAAAGITVVYITHRLQEIMSVTDRIIVLRNGAVTHDMLTSATTQEQLILSMGETAAKTDVSEDVSPIIHPAETNQAVHLRCSNLNTNVLRNVTCDLRGGMLVGVGGLEGNGQRELLQAMFHPRRGARKNVARKGMLAYVTGNRKEAGIFPLWSVAENTTITSLMRGGLCRFHSSKHVETEAASWMRKLKIKSAGPQAPILSLSGGNQQKVLIARALLSQADIILLDDPTRGVDVETKQQLYQLFQQAVHEGKLVLWYSSDDSELSRCDQVLVMRHGSIVRILEKHEISEQNILASSFVENNKTHSELVLKHRRLNLFTMVPFLTMVATYVACGLLYPVTFSLFGVELLISGALPLIMAALSQTFIIGYSHINLSLGNFMGLISVIGASFLYERPLIGILMIFAAVLAHGAMGVLIRRLDIPAVIVTLAFSFIWYGIAIVIRSSPGGTAPQWLTGAFNQSLLGVSNVLWFLLAVCVLTACLERSKWGTVLRGFGNREDAMVRSGWNRNLAVLGAYFIAGIFAMLGGLSFTALTYSSDASAMNSYTLLTVASVILGGGMLSGGRVSVLGSVSGAITLSLVTILLGFLRVHADYIAAVQGALLIGILAMRLLRKRAA